MKLEHTIEIDAPPELVWAVTVDVERWPEWTPTMNKVRRIDDGPFVAGSRAIIKQPGLPEAEWTVTELVEGVSFTWRTRVRGMRMAATHEISPLGSGVRNLLRVEISGLGAWTIWPLLRLGVARALQQENEGLKRVCEDRSPPP